MGYSIKVALGQFHEAALELRCGTESCEELGRLDIQAGQKVCKPDKSQNVSQCFLHTFKSYLWIVTMALRP